MRYFLFVLVFLIAGCGATFNDSMTPDPKLVRSEFDGTVEIFQSSVSSANGLGEEWTTLGLFWTERAPDVVVMKAGVAGITGIARIGFNVDGEIFEYTDTTTALTQFDTNPYQDWSHKAFIVPIEDFRKIVDAQTVKFKVVRIDNSYGVSTFGKSHMGAVISSKLPKFVQLLNNS